jgi:hypothetical protein
MADVYKDLANRDKGAAKPLKEKLDELKRSKGQEAIAAEWADKANTLLAVGKLNLADALAWQRDAAKAGAPLSKEPLAALKVQLAERVRAIEDLEHHTQVQREAAVLLAQRIEILSTKSWQEAQAAAAGLHADVAHWQAQALELQGKRGWPSVDVKFAGMLDASLRQLTLVSDAFDAAAQMAVAAAQDPAAPLPPVPVWAEALRAQRFSKVATICGSSSRTCLAVNWPSISLRCRAWEGSSAVARIWVGPPSPSIINGATPRSGL